MTGTSWNGHRFFGLRPAKDRGVFPEGNRSSHSNRGHDAVGRAPRLAQRRVILFFWPTRASSANQTSMASGSTPFRARSAPGVRGGFFKILDSAGGLRVMARTGREFAIAHGAQFAAQRLLGDDGAEFLPYPLAEIDDPPAYDAMSGGDRTALR